MKKNHVTIILPRRKYHSMAEAKKLSHEYGKVHGFETTKFLDPDEMLGCPIIHTKHGYVLEYELPKHTIKGLEMNRVLWLVEEEVK